MLKDGSTLLVGAADGMLNLSPIQTTCSSVPCFSDSYPLLYYSSAMVTLSFVYFFRKALCIRAENSQASEDDTPWPHNSYHLHCTTISLQGTYLYEKVCSGPQ